MEIDLRFKGRYWQKMKPVAPVAKNFIKELQILFIKLILQQF